MIRGRHHALCLELDLREYRRWYAVILRQTTNEVSVQFSSASTIGRVQGDAGSLSKRSHQAHAAVFVANRKGVISHEHLLFLFRTYHV